MAKTRSNARLKRKITSTKSTHTSRAKRDQAVKRANVYSSARLNGSVSVATRAATSTFSLSGQIFIVIPAYNESKVIESVLSDLQAAGWKNIVVVDDCSTDRTYEIISGHDVFLLRHVINRGQGAALKTGIDFALRQGAQIIVTFDSDGQHCVEEINRIIKPVIDGRADAALGSRFLGTTSNTPAIKRAVLRCGILFTWIFSGVLLTDTHNGFRALSRRAASRIEIKHDRMEHASEIIDEIYKKRIKFVEVPVTVKYTEYSITHGQNPLNSVMIAFRLILRRMMQ